MAPEKAEHLMRPGIIIAIVAVIAVLIGGIVWYNNTQAENVRVEQQQREQAEQTAREQDAARDEARLQEEEAAQAARDAQETGGVADPDAAIVEDEAASGGEAEATLDSGDASGTGATTTAAASIDPEQLLTPENFDRDEVLALIDTSEQLTSEERLTLRAQVEDANADPDMIEAALESIRAALDLPPLN